MNKEKFREKYLEFFEQLDEKYWHKERFVPAVGKENADFMLVGEAPGANEVEEGEPFVGRAGERMNEVLEELGVDRAELYITNLVKIRPPNNRDPKKEEIEAWRPLLLREIEEVDPDVILPLGNFASKQLTGTSKGITKTHGKQFKFHSHTVIPVFHPAATLYDRSKMPEFKKDLANIFNKSYEKQKGLGDF